MDAAEPSVRKVCVIYTGGTIGMLLGEHGYQPEPYYLTSALRLETRFNDHAGDSLLSNSRSIREWRNHNTSSSGLPSTPREPANPDYSNSHPLPVRSTRPISLPDGSSTSKEISESVYETLLPSLLTPASSTDTKVRYAILEWNPILDSSNLERSDWVRLATEIELNYANFDAFIVLHGTDTICYTTSALSYLLEDLGKTVIVTGAQIPLSQLRNDAVDNLLGSLSIAGRFIIPEVCLYFNHRLFRGNRVSKVSSFDLEAFASPNYPPLVEVGTEIVVNWRNVLTSKNIRRFRAHKSMDADVAVLRLFPGITAASARSFLSPPIKGVVLESFGAGNAPQRRDLMDVIKEACDRGVVIVTISQCAKGSVSIDYAAGKSLADAGVTAGADMTPEAALAKLSYLLSKPELTTPEIRKLMAAPLRGELTISTPVSAGLPGGLQGIQQVMTQLLRLVSAGAPQISPSTSLSSVAEPSLSAKARDVTASWSLTESDTEQTEIALLPYLIHIAAAKNDIEGLQFCISASQNNPALQNSPGASLFSPSTESGAFFGGNALGRGICNILDTSGRSPLHTAVLNGALPCVRLLLENGASVHARDLLDHTVLYYARRQGHHEIAQLLIDTGAMMSGSDMAIPSVASLPEQ